ncbi:hypothetical protein D9758_008161 [Tetrapyrgos nigripes]|uniref:tripeptidyl-peptidase II n=1 Tax=Tetrapyrgos nigripes TaxID=182062 RepID=A0A8H5GHK1_9AGAR|nr:hypothetical protein D9758_008161 [Tetrapyrgos nigripes]
MKTLSIVVVVTLGFGLGTLSAATSSSSPTIPIAIPHVHGYTRLSRAPPSLPLPHPLKLALTQPSSSLSQIDRYLYEVSDPSSDKFGKHWNVERIREVFEPSGETVRVVREWLEEMGYDDDENETMMNIPKPKPKSKPKRAVTYKNGWIEVNATVGEAERLLSTEYHVYAHIESGRKHVVSTPYHLPAHIAPHVEVVIPTVDFNVGPMKHFKRASSVNLATSTSSGIDSTNLNDENNENDALNPQPHRIVSTIYNDLSHCDEQMTPKCLRALYGFDYVPSQGSNEMGTGNSIGIVEYTPQAYLQTDLDKFFREFSPDLRGSYASPLLASIDGGIAQTIHQTFDLNGESDLDLEYAMTLVTKNQPVTLYQVGDIVEGGSFNNFLDALDFSYCSYDGGDDPSQDEPYPDGDLGGLAYTGPQACGTLKPTYVISTSYGYNEADLSEAYARRQCFEYAKLGLMGITVIYSSGDNGVAGNFDLCLNPDGSQTPNGTIFNPGFPATCPYVTSVGATQVIPGANVTNRSSVQSDYSGSGSGSSTSYEPEMACSNVIFSGGGFSNYFEMPMYQEESVKTWLEENPVPPAWREGVFNNSGNSRGFPDLAANGASYVVAMDGVFNLVYGTSASAPVFASMITMINDARISNGKGPVGFINPVLYSSSFKSAFHNITRGTNPGCGKEGFRAVAGWNPVTGLGTPDFQELLAKFMDLP